MKLQKRKVIFALGCAALLYNGDMSHTYAAGAENTNKAVARAIVGGQCGTELQLRWEYDNGKLTITGNGAMSEYDIKRYSAYYSDIRTVEIGEGVTVIGKKAFSGFYNLQKVIIPASVTRIEDSAFESCADLTKIEIPTGVVSIGNRAFVDCYSLSDVVLTDTVTTIGDYAFSQCPSLKEIHIPDSVITIGKAAFKGCYSVNKAKIGDNVTSIGAEAFSGCSELKNVVLPNSVRDMGAKAFAYCINLKDIKLSENTNCIETGLFFGCMKLESIDLPEGIQTIKNEAFYMTGIERLQIPRSVASILPINVFPENSVLFGYQETVAERYAKENNVQFVELDKRLVFDLNGGDSSAPAYRLILKGQAYGELPEKPTRVNHTFLGWFTEKNGGTQVTEKTVAEDNITVYAQWKANSYTIRFDGNNATSGVMEDMKNQEVGQFYKLAANRFARKGYTFAGWNTKANGTGTAIADEASVKDLTTENNGKVTLYAQWNPLKYQVTFNQNGGNQPSKTSITIAHNIRYGVLPTCTRTGYTFTGWYTQQTGGTRVTDTTEATGNATLYAQWKVNTYKVTFNQNGGVKPSKESVTVTYNGKYGTLPTCTRTGYTFLGWFTAKTGGTKVTAATVAKGNVTVYAQWKVNGYTVTFDQNGGNKPSKVTLTVANNNKIGTLPSCTRKGYQFDGWYTAKTKGTKVTKDTVIKANTKVYARWTKVSVSKASISKLKAGSKSMDVTTKKITGVTGYEVSYSTKSNMKSSKTVKATKNTSKITGLKKNTKYYVSVRAYKVDSTGNVVYGSWSTVKSVKVK